MISVCSHFYFCIQRRNILSMEVSWLDTAKLGVPPASPFNIWSQGGKSLIQLAQEEILPMLPFIFHFLKCISMENCTVLTVQYLYRYSYSVPVQNTGFFLCLGTKYKINPKGQLFFCFASTFSCRGYFHN